MNHTHKKNTQIHKRHYSTILSCLFVSTDGTDEGGIVDSTFWVENGVKFGRFTCNASSYFQDVLYIWTFPCQNELIRDKTSECSTSLTDQKEEITCIAINASTSMNVFDEGLLDCQNVYRNSFNYFLLNYVTFIKMHDNITLIFVYSVDYVLIF